MLPSKITHELSLERLDPKHADVIFQLTDKNRTYLRQWLPWVDSTHTTEDTRAFIITTQAQFERNEGFQMAIVWQGEIVGAIGHHRIDWANRST
ncbi:MAG: GNAT family N-acetyltransferase, partial [Cyanobacteria bacterium P01_D01_bin.44]